MKLFNNLLFDSLHHFWYVNMVIMTAQIIYCKCLQQSEIISNCQQDTNVSSIDIKKLQLSCRGKKGNENKESVECAFGCWSFNFFVKLYLTRWLLLSNMHSWQDLGSFHLTWLPYMEALSTFEQLTSCQSLFY